MSYEPVEFESEGATLRGRLYWPSEGSESPLPIVVMTHGLSATVGMVSDRYAEVFQAAGLAVLLYDHRNFGASDGEPRYQLSNFLQVRGYRDAISYASTLDGVDTERIAVWGDSMSGRVALMVASVDERVRVLVVQVPACGGAPPPEYSEAALARARELYLAEGVYAPLADEGEPTPVVSSDQIHAPSYLKPITAYRWFLDFGGRPEMGWENRMTRAVEPEGSALHAGCMVQGITATTLMMVSPVDEMAGSVPEVARQVFERISSEKEWADIGGGHFGLVYYPSELFDEASLKQREFLVRVLAGAGA